MLEKQIDEIQLSRSGLLDQISALQTRLSGLDENLQTLQHQHDTIYRTIQAENNHAHNFRAPISSLPNEILSLIFEQCHAGDPGVENVLCTVTRSWRDIALSTPCIWTRLTVTDETPVDKLHTHLQRSRGNDLDVILHPRVFYTGDGHILLNIVVVFQVSDLWRTLQIDLEEGYLWNECLEMLPLFVPRLTSLDIRVAEYSARLNWPGPMFEGGAPLLTSVALSGIGLSSTFPFAMIRDLIICDTHRAVRLNDVEFARLVGGHPHLTSLCIYGDNVFDCASTHTNIELPCVRRLRLGGFISYPDLAALFSMISTPSLDHLLFEEIPEGVLRHALMDRRTDLPFTSLLKSLSVKLTEAVWVDRNIWRELARVFPSITHLHLTDSDTFKSTLGSLCMVLALETPILWPRLESISLDVDGNAWVDGFVEMLDRRYSFGKPIQTLYLSQLAHISLLRNRLAVHPLELSPVLWDDRKGRRACIPKYDEEWEY